MTSEPFTFNWPGKSEASALARVPATCHLAPDVDESVEYAATANLFIEGDNLEALRILAPDYRGAVRMIYIDPPYNTGRAFIYPDRFAARGLGARPAPPGGAIAARRHSDWLSMMLPRLILARELLSEDGILFVSIDDGEVHRLRMLLEEVFGAESFVANIVWQKKYTRSNDARWFSNNHDYILAFARKIDRFKLNLLSRNKAQALQVARPSFVMSNRV